MGIIITSKKKLDQSYRELNEMYERSKQSYTEKILDYKMKSSVDNLNDYLRLDKTAVIRKVFVNKQGVLSFVIMIPAGKNNYDFYVRSSEIRHCGIIMSGHPCLFAKIWPEDNKIEIIDIMSKEYKRRGYGRAIMEALFDLAEEKNINKIVGKLSSVDEKDPENEKARNKFYESMGFEFNENIVIKKIKPRE